MFSTTQTDLHLFFIPCKRFLLASTGLKELLSFQGHASAEKIIFPGASNLICHKWTAAGRLSSPSKGLGLLCWDW